jgi:flagellar hook-associated protein 1 FlgK
LLDQLSKLVDIKIDNLDTGQINLYIGGQAMIKGVDLVDTLQVTTNAGPVPLPDDVPALISTVNGSVVLNDGVGPEITSGTLKGISDMGGNNPNFSTIRSVLGKLDNLISTIATQVNNLQTTGRDQYGNLATGTDMFTLDSSYTPGDLRIFHWQVNPVIQGDPKRIATASDDFSIDPLLGGYAGIGDGSNALKIAQLRDQTFGTLGTGFVDYFNGVVSKLGIDTKSYMDGSTAQGNLLQSVNLQRQSVSGVNIEEEMIDMLRYQRAFEATSKTIKMFDEVYQTIINMAG